jgi:hypothetical protein
MGKKDPSIELSKKNTYLLSKRDKKVFFFWAFKKGFILYANK